MLGIEVSCLLFSRLLGEHVQRCVHRNHWRGGLWTSDIQVVVHAPEFFNDNDSLVSQRLQWINLRGSPHRYPARQHPHTHEQRSDNDQRRGIAGLHFEQE